MVNWYQSAVENRWKFPFILQVAVLTVSILACVGTNVYVSMYMYAVRYAWNTIERDQLLELAQLR